jgi:uncharacterized protein with HEPN domain
LRRDIERLQDILEAVDRIQKYAAKGREAFNRDELLQVWVIHHLEIIGEASRGLSDELRGRHASVPWSEIIGMRNILVHDYFGLNLDEVWSAVERDLPASRSHSPRGAERTGLTRPMAGIWPTAAPAR